MLLGEETADLGSRLKEGGVAAGLAKVIVEIGLLANQPLDQSEESIGEIRIELGAAAKANLGERAVRRPGLREGSAVGEGVEHVGKRNDARVQGDSVSSKLRWISLAIPPLVVVQGDLLRNA